jgi:hypothetical protein
VEQCIEYRIWKQTIAAFKVDQWYMVGDPPNPSITAFTRCESMLDALSRARGELIFCIPDADYEYHELPDVHDPVYVFGNAQENLKDYLTDSDLTLRLPTPAPVDMFACACLPWVLGNGPHR